MGKADRIPNRPTRIFWEREQNFGYWAVFFGRGRKSKGDGSDLQ